MQEQFGQKGVKQIERMVRQRTRQERVEEIVRTDEGLEPVSGTPMRLVDTEGDYADYFHIIRAVCDRLTKDDVVSGVYQDCLYLVGTTRRHLERSGFRDIAHRLFHMRNPDRHCALSEDFDSDIASHELADTSDMSGVVDLVDANLHSGWSRSLFDWPLDAETI